MNKKQHTPEYMTPLAFDEEGPYIDDIVWAQVTPHDEEGMPWRIEVTWSNTLAIYIKGHPDWEPNEWRCEDAEIWLDRRAPTDIPLDGLYVAKLSCYDEVAFAINCFRAQRQEVEAALATRKSTDDGA